MIILGTNSIKDTGFDVANSCRFDGSSSSLNLAPSSGGSLKKATYSFWLKKCINGTAMEIFSHVAVNNNTDFRILFAANDKLYIINQDNTSDTVQLFTNRLFRDPSAWYHIVIAIDTTDATAGDRVKVYVNGIRETSFSTQNNPSQDEELKINGGTNTMNFIGQRYTGSSSIFFNGYMAEVVYVNGTANAVTDFGEFDEDSGIWKPIDVSGLTFGTNGFYLDFEDSANLGNDASGGTDFTENGLAAIDQSTDTCTNNGNTFQPLDLQASTQTLAEGNLKVTTDSGGDWDTVASTIGVTSGKWYFEAKLITLGSNAIIGVIDINDARLNTTSSYYIGQSTPGCGYQNNGARPDTGASFGNSYTNNDIIGVAIDMDNLKVYFSKNGTFQNSGDPTSGATGTGAQDLTANTTYCFAVSGYSSTVWEANFGSPAFAISSGNTDGDGYGNFEYAVPSGYYSLNTKNLAEYG